MALQPGCDTPCVHVLSYTYGKHYLVRLKQFKAEPAQYGLGISLNLLLLLFYDNQNPHYGMMRCVGRKCFLVTSCTTVIC